MGLFWSRPECCEDKLVECTGCLGRVESKHLWACLEVVLFVLFVLVYLYALCCLCLFVLSVRVCVVFAVFALLLMKLSVVLHGRSVQRLECVAVWSVCEGACSASQLSLPGLYALANLLALACSGQ